MAVECPECGAPRAAGETACRYCGARFDRPPARPPVIPTVKDPPKRPTGRGATSGCLVALALVLVIGGGMVALLVGLTGGGGTAGIPKIGGGNVRVHPTGAAVPLPSDGAGAPDTAVIAQTFDGGRSGVELAYYEGASGKQRWRLALDKDKGREAQIVGDGQTLFVFDGTGDVIAVDRRTGDQRWRARAPFPPPPACEVCTVLTGGRFVVVGADGTVQAFDVSTGAQVWTHRLSDAPRVMHAVTGGIAVMSKIGDATRSTVGVVVLGAEAGARREIPLSCPSPDNPRASANTPALFDPLVSVEGGARLIAFYRGCVQRVDVGAGTASVVASFRSGEIGASISLGRFEDHPGLVVDGTNLLLGFGNVAVGVPLNGGTTVRVEVDKRYQLAPITMRDGRFVVTASPDFARDRPEVWGLDVNDRTTPANPVWRHPVPTKAVSDEWRARATPAGIALVECNDDKDECLFSTLAVPDGRQLGTSTGGDLFTTAFLDLTQDDRYSWYTVGTKMFLVEHATARLVWSVGGD